MSADKSHLLGLIGLLALAERDPMEYRRVTDLSKRELDQRISVLRKEVDDPECDALYQQVVEVTQSPESLQEADIILQQVYLTSVLKSQYESVRAAKEQLLPSEIIESKMRSVGVRWRSETKKRQMYKSLTALNEMILRERPPDDIYHCLSDIVHQLSRKEVVTGSVASKKTVIWEICKEIHAKIGRPLEADASADNLWKSARAGAADAEKWLGENAPFVDAPAAQELPARQDSVE